MALTVGDRKYKKANMLMATLQSWSQAILMNVTAELLLIRLQLLNSFVYIIFLATLDMSM